MIRRDQLVDCIGTYGESPNGYLLLQRSALYAEADDRQAWNVGVRRAELIPTGPDKFTLEFTETPIQFDRRQRPRRPRLFYRQWEGPLMTRFVRTAP